MVANVRCSEIKQEQLAAFAADQAWQALESEAEQGLVPKFGTRLGDLLDSCVSGWVAGCCWARQALHAVVPCPCSARQPQRSMPLSTPPPCPPPPSPPQLQRGGTVL
jgi:hypothetical protein